MDNPTAASPSPLPDLREARIDPLLPADQRIRLFVETLQDPYIFRVGETPVETRFAAGAPSLQSCLMQLCERLQ